MGRIASRLTFLTEFAEDTATDATAAVPTVDSDENLVIPADLTAVPDAELAAMHSGAVDAFNALYAEREKGLTDEQLSALSVLTEGIERVDAELQTRKGAEAERAEKAAALAARAGIVEPVTEATSEDATALAAAEAAVEEAAVAAAEPEKPAEIRVNLAGLRRSTVATVPAAMATTEGTGSKPTRMEDIVTAEVDLPGYAVGTGLDWDAIGKGIDRSLANFNRATWESAAQRKQHLSSQQSLVVVRKPFDEGLSVVSDDPGHVERVLAYATDESRLTGNSLVAAGGWCAPSDTIYDLMELESRDGLYSLPTINVTRGGIKHTPGPDFASIFANVGFTFTEAEDIVGDYDGAGSTGRKPCYKVPCPSFVDDRLRYNGLCINAGLLQQRGYPEVIARTVRGALVAHDHKISAGVLNAVIAGSTAVSMPANQVGATAPVLTAIELQVEHYRTTHRLPRGTSLEAVFPFWVRGAVRSDLSRRQGVELLSVSDAQIAGWFADRGVSPQFVYNFDDLSGAATTATAWPTTVRFVLYAAGTWVRGSSDIISLDTIYDSLLLGTNDFTALFTEEGWMVAKRGHDSRVVSVNIATDGATHGGVSIAHDGSQSGAAQV